MLEKVSNDVPEFWIWTVLTEDSTPVVTLPKSRVDGVRVTAGAVATPVPDSAAVTGVTPLAKV